MQNLLLDLVDLENRAEWIRRTRVADPSPEGFTAWERGRIERGGNVKAYSRATGGRRTVFLCHAPCSNRAQCDQRRRFQQAISATVVVVTAYKPLASRNSPGRPHVSVAQIDLQRGDASPMKLVTSPAYV